MNTSTPTLAGFAAWLEKSAAALTDAAAKASTAGDPARGRQIYTLANFLRPIGQACQAFAAGQVPELDLVGPPTQPAQTARENVVDFLARFQRELDELNAGSAVLEAELQAIGRRVSAQGEAKLAVIERLAAEMKSICAGLPD